MSWTVQLSRQAVKDAKRLAQSGYKEKAKNLLNILKTPLSLAKGMNCHA